MINKRSYSMLLFFVVLVAGVAISGVMFQPGEWYANLAKPFWTPPNWLFPPVWSALYIMIAVAGWLIFSSNDSFLKILWISQLVLNGLWSWLFFGSHFKGLALIDILAMLACIIAIIVFSSKSTRTVFCLMIPYVIWVGYASTLNAGIYAMN